LDCLRVLCAFRSEIQTKPLPFSRARCQTTEKAVKSHAYPVCCHAMKFRRFRLRFWDWVLRKIPFRRALSVDSPKRVKVYLIVDTGEPMTLQAEWELTCEKNPLLAHAKSIFLSVEVWENEGIRPTRTATSHLLQDTPVGRGQSTTDDPVLTASNPHHHKKPPLHASSPRGDQRVRNE
jgi:hypothetical protein